MWGLRHVREAYEQKAYVKSADSKLNSFKHLIFKGLNNGQISEQEFKIILEGLGKYNNLKEKTHLRQPGLSENEKGD